MDVIFNHHMDTKGIINFKVQPTERPTEYAFLFTNESPGIRVVTFGLHTGEKERAYSLPEWDMDSENNLIDRPVAENSGKVDEDQEFEGQTETDNKDEPHHESAADEDLINDHKIHLKRVYSAAKAMKAQTAMSLNRQYAHNENISNSHSWTYYAMLFELLCFLGILGFQMHHIKKTLDNKLVLWKPAFEI